MRYTACRVPVLKNQFKSEPAFVECIELGYYVPRKFGTAPDAHLELVFPPLQPSVIIEFRSTPLYKDKSFLLENYVEKGLNIAEVAAICFSTRNAVRNGLKRFEIPIKAQDELLKTKQQLKFGEMRRKRQIVANQRERVAIEKMKALRAQGFSY